MDESGVQATRRLIVPAHVIKYELLSLHVKSQMENHTCQRQKDWEEISWKPFCPSVCLYAPEN